ncbi:hypothetical protein [Caballeronia sp. LZ032]|uniref:hypothetical protein n=1 Tax=Caballeronia sp. LZ032 TaxID=3038565 RepID=UPI00285FAB6F|nr:hypothetical protein [Caballeronia sp. LZ032]MDR5877797.1 hypothetical protein [Caballeronia sp. LZ032]
MYGLNAILQTVAGDRQYPKSRLNQGTGTQWNEEELAGTVIFFRDCAGTNTKDSHEKWHDHTGYQWSHQRFRFGSGSDGRNIARCGKPQSCMLRRAIAGFELIALLNSVFPALLGNTSHAQAAEATGD